MRINEASWVGERVEAILHFHGLEPGSPYYCLEWPWMSPPNAPENKTPSYVSPGAREEFTVEIETCSTNAIRGLELPPTPVPEILS